MSYFYQSSHLSKCTQIRNFIIQKPAPLCHKGICFSVTESRRYLKKTISWLSKHDKGTVRLQRSWSRVSNSVLQDGPQFKGLEKRMEEALLSGDWLIVLSFYIPNLNTYPYIFIPNEYKIFVNLVWHFLVQIFQHWFSIPQICHLWYFL